MQELELSSVIEKIKTEGVEKAEQEARDIVQEAEARAKDIIAEASRQKEDIIREAKDDAARLELNGKNAVKQAARDVLIALRAQIIALLDNVVKKEISGQLSPETMKEIIVHLVTNCMDRGSFDLEILLSEKDKEKLRKLLESAMKNEFKKGVTLKVSPGVTNGFRIGEKDKNLYYDFTDDAIAEAFNVYINKKIREILDMGIKDGQ